MIQRFSERMKPIIRVLAASILASLFLPHYGCNPAGRQEGIQVEEKKKGDIPMEKATFGAGCFWGVQAAFDKVEGVISTRVGYAGGWKENPSYEEVCSGRTGHAEVVEITYDPTKLRYEGLLRRFFDIHDPTTPNRQGADIGAQYRSVIFYHNARQEALARSATEKLTKSVKYQNPVVTEIQPAQAFYLAEDYHQQYLKKSGLGSVRTN